MFTSCFSPRHRSRGTLRLIALARAIALVLLLAGCGSSSNLPPAALPAHSPPLTQVPAGTVVRGNGAVARRRAVAVVDQGRALAVLSPRQRTLAVYDRATRRPLARIPAGVGPTHVVGGRGGLIYVVDTAGDGLLVFELRPHLHLTRRLPVLGSPYGIAADPVNQRLWVATTGSNRLVELADGARPHRLRSFPTVRQPDTVTVDPQRHRVSVTGRADGVVQTLDVPDR